MFTITATNLPRLMACPGSRLMGEAEAPITSNNVVKDEGIAADWLVKQVHSGRFAAEELIERKSENNVIIEPEMIEYLEEYLEQIKTGDIEVTLDNVAENWRINGRADLVQHKPQVLEIGDLKYGYRIVEPKENWTLISHAMAWRVQNPDVKIDWFTFTIYQPRAYHPEGRTRHWSISNVEMQGYFDQLLQLMNSLETRAQSGNLENAALNTGTHCTYCPAYTTCPAARMAENNCIDASFEAFTDTLTNDELAARLSELARAEAVIKESNKAFKELAVHRLKEGQKIHDYSCTTELTNRQFRKDVTADYIEMMTGVDPTVKKLMTPAAVEKAGVSKEFVKTLTERHTKGVKLVQISADARAKQLLKIKGK